MSRYIIIDNYSGYIWGDTGDLDGPARLETPVEACQRLDESNREYGREYEEVGRFQLATNQTGYHVYRADIDGSEVVPLVTDGHDAETLLQVKRLCRYETTVRISNPAEERQRLAREGRDI